MYREFRIAVVIPALNEENAIGVVVEKLRALQNPGNSPLIDQIMVCDNGSSDATAKVAQAAGAQVVPEPIPGYGRACLTAIAALAPCDIVLFVDGDDSLYPEQALALLEGIAQGNDLSIGSRVLGTMQKGALTLPQRFGNWLAAKLIYWLWDEKITDLGPFRAVRRSALNKLKMQDQTFGWTVEMQIKAIQLGLLMQEYAVDSKVRIGQSKISGTLKGTIGAARGILGTIFKLRWQQRDYLLASVKESS